MSLFTIAQLSELSGIKQHTIRIWEKRYNLLEPDRTDTNIRRYDDIQLKRLLNTVTLLNNGVKISKIATFSEKQIQEQIGEIINKSKSDDQSAEVFINQLFAAGLTYDEAGFEKAFASAILRFGIKGSYEKIIYPMLLRAGYMWQNTTLTPCQEHFMSNLVRRKFFTAIDSIPLPSRSKRKWLLFLPEGEYHEIGLLFACYLIRSHGHSVLYLGASVPYDDMLHTASEFKPTDILFFTVHRFPKADLQKFIRSLEHDFRKATLYAAGDSTELNGIKVAKDTHLITSVSEFEKAIK